MTLHFYKTLDPIGSNFLCIEPSYRKFGEVPPPGTKIENFLSENKSLDKSSFEKEWSHEVDVK